MAKGGKKRVAGRPLQSNMPFHEAVALLKESGVVFAQTLAEGTEKGAMAAAVKLGFPVFMKVVSTPSAGSVIHKSRSGLVARVENAAALEAAFRRLAAAHSALASKGILEKRLLVAVQKEDVGVECIIGARRDPSFGPVVIFGTGGVLTEEFRDVALKLCPVTKEEAASMVKESKVYWRLKQLKDGGLLLDKLAAYVSRVSGLIATRQSLSELDVNPVVVAKDSVVAVDIRAVAAASWKGNSASGKTSAWKTSAVVNFFSPRSIAVIGASRSPDSVGQSIMRNLTIGCVHRCEYCRPFLGKLFPVNPFASEILGMKSYPSINAVPEPVDLAIVAVPREVVPKAVEDCIRKKVKAVIVISAGFGEFDEAGKRLQLKIAERLEKARIPLLGPNCLGIIRPAFSLNASFGPSMPPKGDVAFISQSGALADSIIDWSIQSRYGFSALVSYGNKAMLDCHDFFGFFGDDPETKAVALYIEGVSDGRLFFERLKSLAVKKPVVILKGGRTGAGVAAATTHTASLAGDVKIFEAAARQAGAILANSVEELFDIAKALAEQPVCKGNGIAVITNGGGCGVLCSDYCDELGISLPELQRSVLGGLDKSGLMHPAYSRRNPLDIVGDAMPQRYELAISALLKEPYIHGLIVIQTLQAMTNPVLDAKAIVEAHKLCPEKPVITCFMGGRFSRKGMHYLDNMRIPDFNDVRKAVVAMKALVERGRFLASIPAGAATAAAKKGVKPLKPRAKK